MPPMTVVSPSFTRTWVFASRRLIEGWPFAPVSCGFGWLLVTRTLIWMEPSCVTWGVTASSRRASMKVVFTPAALVCAYGIDTPCPIVAWTLSRVTARGELMVLMVPLFSAAERRRLSCAAPPALPRTKPMPPPLLRPIGAGMFTAKFGTVTPFSPPSGAAGSSAAPAACTMLGNTRPVGLPVGGDADDVAHLLLPEGLGPEDDVERLVPGHVAQLDRDGALHVVGDDDVLLADLGDGAEQVPDVDVLDVEVDATSRVLARVEDAGAGRGGTGLHRHRGGARGGLGGLRLRSGLGAADVPGDRFLGGLDRVGRTGAHDGDDLDLA